MMLNNGSHQALLHKTITVMQLQYKVQSLIAEGTPYYFYEA